MPYTPNPMWYADTVITAQSLNNLETQYAWSKIYLDLHNHDDRFFTKSYMNSTFWNEDNDGPGSGSDADMIYHPSGNKHGSSFFGLGIPKGIIILWSGSIESIQSGWVLCDGQNETPDMRGRFVMGAGATNPRVIGGSSTFTASGTITISPHVLTINELAPHTHPFSDRVGVTGGLLGGQPYCAANCSMSGTTAAAGGGGGHTHTSAEGTALVGTPVQCVPHYYALAYIMKT